MKHYIATAALIAAGTAFSNAAVIELADTSNTTSVVATSLLTAENAASIIATNDLNKALLGITVGEYSWSIGVGTYNDTDQQLHIYYVVAGNEVSGDADASFSGDDWPSNGSLSSAFDSTEDIVGGALTLGYAGTNAQSTSGTAVVFSVKYADGSVVTISGLRSEQRYSNDSPVSLSYDDSLLGVPAYTASADDWTLDSLVATNTAALPAVPEPSAFGLLAGLGALALVASRRRRK